MILKNKKVNTDKLTNYGFEQSNGKYIYLTDICDEQLRISVTIDVGGEVFTEIYDTAAEDVYTLHLVEGAVGAFVGRVRTEYDTLLKDIENKCFDIDVFKENHTEKLLDYAKTKYGDVPEHLWAKTPEYAVLRRKDNAKWYAVVMVIPSKRIGLEGDDLIEIVDLRIDPEKLSQKVDGKRYFAGYHMNKRHWITLLLDGSIPFDEIANCLDSSYLLAK